MAEQEQHRGIFGRIGAHLWNRFKAIGPEIYQTTTDKVIPQGAGEIAHALNTGSAYVPYGSAQSPLEVAEKKGTVHGTPEPSFEQKVEQHSRGPEPDQGRDMER